MPELIVDIHPHIVSEDTQKYPIDPIGGTRSEWSHKRSVDLDSLLASMAEAGVAKAAIVHSSTTYGFDCSYVADAVSAHPGQLTGVHVRELKLPSNVEKVPPKSRIVAFRPVPNRRPQQTIEILHPRQFVPAAPAV